jgi:hypothetical protein
MAGTFASSVLSESGQASVSSPAFTSFDPMNFEPIVSWEHDTVEILSDEGNSEELEWLVRLLTICEPYPVEGLEPMNQAYPYSSEDIDEYVSYLLDPQADIYEYDGRYYLGPEACYGFDDDDFVYLDDQDRGVGLGLPPGLYNILFPPAAGV